MVSGTQGYERFIDCFIESSQSLNFHEICKDFISHLPSAPARILDAGSGAGQNSAALAKMGYTIVAVEPMEEFRSAAREKYVDLSITWLIGNLPKLECLDEMHDSFDFVLIDGVWHHLEIEEREIAIRRIASLLKKGGKVAMSLRNGPPGMGTCVYPTDVNETIAHGKLYGLNNVFCLENQSSFMANKKDVEWARIVLEKQ